MNKPALRVRAPIPGEVVRATPDTDVPIECYLVLIEAIVNGFEGSPTKTRYEQRAEWFALALPRTSTVLSLTRRWLEASDLSVAS